jgi:hypothetical protein
MARGCALAALLGTGSANADVLTFTYTGPSFVVSSDPFAGSNIVGQFTVDGLPAGYSGTLDFVFPNGVPSYQFGSTVIPASAFITAFSFTSGSDTWTSAQGQSLSLNDFVFTDGLPTQWLVRGGANTNSVFTTEADGTGTGTLQLDSVYDVINDNGFSSLSRYPSAFGPIVGQWSVSASTVPEPPAFALLLPGLLAVVGLRRLASRTRRR